MSGAVLMRVTPCSGPSFSPMQALSRDNSLYLLAHWGGMFVSMSITSNDLISVCFFFLFFSLSCPLWSHSLLSALAFAEPLSAMPIGTIFSFTRHSHLWNCCLQCPLSTSFARFACSHSRSLFSFLSLILGDSPILGTACVVEEK